MMDDYFERRFGVDDALCQRIMRTALRSGGDRSDLFFQQRTDNVVALEDGEVNRAYRSADLGVGIRVVRGEATGYAFCEELTEQSMLAAARIASSIAEGGTALTPKPVRAVAPRLDLYRVEVPWSEVGIGDRMPLLQRLCDRAQRHDQRITKVRVRFSDSDSHVLIVDSDGRRSYDCRPMTVAFVFCVAESGTRKEENYHSVGGRHGIDFYSPQRLDELADEAARRTLLLFESRRPQPGEMPVVLAAGSSGILLHEAIGHGMEADFNRKKTSIYSESIGKHIAEPIVSIADDGTVPAARGSINVDDEGNATECTMLVEQGVLRTYLHDEISARFYGVKPTGNGRRQSFRHPPMPRMRNTYMLPGPHDPDEIIRSIKRGIYAVTFTNGQVRIGAGDFTFYIKTGYLIEDGRITHPIKDANLIGNGPKVLRDVVMVGRDMELDRGGWTCGKDGQSVAVAIGMPTVKVSAITVGGV